MSLPVPYYSEDGITIYNADCRDIVSEIGNIDLCLTDPPYPNMKGGHAITFDMGVGKLHRPSKTVGVPWGDDISILGEYFKLCLGGMLVFCSFHSLCSVPSIVGKEPCLLSTRHKPNATPSMFNAPQFSTEFIWAFRKEKSNLNWKSLKSLYEQNKLNAGCMATERICDENGKSRHPTQKPINLILKLMEIGGETILDPFMGSGTTLRAAKDLGRKAIGIEINKDYCEIAVERLRQQILI